MIRIVDHERDPRADAGEITPIFSAWIVIRAVVIIRPEVDYLDPDKPPVFHNWSNFLLTVLDEPGTGKIETSLQGMARIDFTCDNRCERRSNAEAKNTRKKYGKTSTHIIRTYYDVRRGGNTPQFPFPFSIRSASVSCNFAVLRISLRYL